MVEATTIAAFLSTTAISLAPNAILFLFPNYKPSKEGINPLAIGQALAAGGLLGDVFLHTLPHASSHENGDGDGEIVGLAVLAGFVVFLLFDILVRSFHDCHDHDAHSSHSHAPHDSTSRPVSNSSQVIGGGKTKIFSFLTPAVVLNLAADSLHNFTDGIAIGASFAGTVTVHDTSLSMFGQIEKLLKSRGGLASLAVLFHEIPHELGDYSILVGAGMTKSQAILAQFSTAIAAYCGTFVGLYGMQSMKDYLGSDLMVPFTAGGFVYLATVTILPNLLEERVGKKARIAQVLAFLVGIGFMYGVAILEHASGSCTHGHHGHDHDHAHDHAHDHHGHAHDHHGHGIDHVKMRPGHGIDHVKIHHDDHNSVHHHHRMSHLEHSHEHVHDKTHPPIQHDSILYGDHIHGHDHDHDHGHDENDMHDHSDEL